MCQFAGVIALTDGSGCKAHGPPFTHLRLDAVLCKQLIQKLCGRQSGTKYLQLPLNRRKIPKQS